MADDNNTPSDEPTTEIGTETAHASTPTAPAVTASAPRRIDGRVLGIAIGGTGVVALVFIAGILVGQGHRDGDRRGSFAGQRMEQMRDGNSGVRGGGSDSRGGQNKRGAKGENGRGAKRGRSHGGSGERPGAGSAGRGNMGVVEGVDDGSITLESLGPGGAVKVTFTDDVKVSRRGDDGARDVKDAKLSDLDKGDIIVVRGARAEGSSDDASDSRTITATHIVILRDAD